MQSVYYYRLDRRVAKLKRALLPRVFSPTGNYADSTYERTRAFQVLAHAEIEYYFEAVANDIAKRSLDAWQQTRKATVPLTAMCVYYSGKYSSIPAQKDGNLSEETLDKRIMKAFNDYQHKLRKTNNGIKEKDILQLFLPIGVGAEQFSDDLLLALNNYGRERGDIAHSTRAASNILTPKDATVATDDLIRKIKSLDEYFFTIINVDSVQ